MKDLLAWLGFKYYPFDKDIKTADVVDTLILQETLARLEHTKRRGGIMLLTGDLGVGKTLATRLFADTLLMKIYSMFFIRL